MKEKTRKIFIMIVMAALIVSLMAASFAALTYGRYAGGRRDENSPYEDYIDFVGATAYEVKTPEQFVNAINSGYSYIKIAADAEKPFVVNNDIANVYTNLVIDVNGNTVIRNSRNPVLDVRRNISVVLVYDSSVGAEGGFYNPVGSALQTSGGTLTVGAGDYESGPKTDTPSQIDGNVPATVWSRTSRTSPDGYSVSSSASMPALSKDVYLKDWTGTENDFIKADTYLLYTKEKNGYVDENGTLYVNAEKKEQTAEDGTTQTVITGDKFTVACNVASCDFYYYYPIGGTTEVPQDYAVVYGYNDVKNMAADVEDMATALVNSGLVWPYAAIRSVRDGTVGGNTHARGGAFTTNFGTDNTYGILSVGGEMTVGTESATAPPTFTAVGEGTCIGMSAQTGDTLTIASGTFTSEVGDTILMRGGEMTVTGGTFTKSGNKARPSDGLEAIEASRTALIHMLGGDLTIDGTFTDKKYSVTMVAGSEQTPLTNVFGIYSEQSSSGDSGTVTVSGCDISVNGTYSAGVLSSAGTVNLGGTAAGKAETNITVNNSISNNLLTSSAVSSEGGTINLNNTVEIKSDSLGITARGIINVGDETQTAANVTVNTDNATGVYVNNGTLNVDEEATLDVESTVNANLEWVTPPGTGPINAPNIYNGVYVQGGSLVSNGTLNVTFTGVENEESGTYLDQQIKSYAVRVEEVENATEENKTTVTITSGNILNGSYDDNGNVIENSGVGGGVLVNGGTVTLGKQETTNGVTTYSGPTVQTTGNLLYATVTQGGWWPNYNYTWNWSYVVDSSWQYMLNKSGGHAVEVSGGSLTVHGGKYTAQQGNGILIRNTSDVKTTNTVTINSGSFVGYNSGYYVEYAYKQTPLGSNRMVGPAASYGLNVMGHDLKVTIKGGTFGEAGEIGNSAASFFGTPGGDKSRVNVDGGTFNACNADAISVFRFINITFDGTASQISSKISDGDVASLSVQDDLLYTGESNRGSTIAIKSGTFTGTAYGIWYACGYDKLSISGDATIEGSTGLQVASAPVEDGIAISGGTITGSNGSGLNLAGAPAASGAVTISGDCKITGKQDGIYSGSNGTAANGLLIEGGTIKGTSGSGLNLAGAPAASGAVTISGDCKITGSNHGVYYGASGAVNDGLLIEGGTITGSNGSGLYFAVNPWQNGGTNNVAIVGGTFNGKPEKKGSDQNPFYINGAISAPSSGASNTEYSGLGKQIRLGDILKTHTGDGKVAYVKENQAWNGNTLLGDNYEYSIAVTVSSKESVSIELYNQ